MGLTVVGADWSGWRAGGMRAATRGSPRAKRRAEIEASERWDGRGGRGARLLRGRRAVHAGPVIEIDGLTKQYGSRVAVDDLTVTIEPGRVTGFLGPNGSGKTTTMRCILGLTRPTVGKVTVLGRPHRELSRPMRRVGALVDPRAPHPGRRRTPTCSPSRRATSCPATGWTT